MKLEDVMKKLKVSKLSRSEADQIRLAIMSPDFPEAYRPWTLEAVQVLEQAIDA